MKFLLLVLMFFVPFYAQADDDRDCELGFAFGRMHIPTEKFRPSSFEKKLMQTPGVFSSRVVRGDSNMRELSVGCFVTDHVFLGVGALDGLRFSIINTVATPSIPQVVDGHVLPFTAANATVIRQADVSAYGIVGRYEWRPTRKLNFYAGGSIYRATANETSQVFVADNAGQSATILGPTEEVKGYFPLLNIGLAMKRRNMRFSLEEDFLPLGVHGVKADVRISF